MIEAKDFSNREKFPGRTGNLFDILLHRAMELEKIPAGIFFVMLIVISLLGQSVNGLASLGVLGFTLFDWISISLLPVKKRSFGPTKPQVLLLAIFRVIPVIFFDPVVWLPLEILGCFLQVYAFWIEPYQIRITHQEYQTSKLSKGTHLKLLHLGDLHLERYSIREERLNRLIKELAPDLILFSGDFLNLSSIHDQEAWAELREVLREWSAPLGVYGVLGSPAVDLEENFPSLVKDTPVQLLRDEIQILNMKNNTIQLIGMDCTHKPHEDFPRLKALLSSPSDNLTILLHHSPDLAPNARELPIDLHFAGHTHGGQVCFPLLGPIFTGSLYGLTFKSGRYLLENLTLYITRGLGVEGLSAPRVRFLCSPEVVLWTITDKKEKS